MKTRKEELLEQLLEIKKTERQSNYDSAKLRLARIYAEVDEQTTIYTNLDGEVDMLICDGDWKEMIQDLEKETALAYKKLVRLKHVREKAKRGLAFYADRLSNQKS